MKHCCNNDCNQDRDCPERTPASFEKFGWWVFDHAGIIQLVIWAFIMGFIFNELV